VRRRVIGGFRAAAGLTIYRDLRQPRPVPAAGTGPPAALTSSLGSTADLTAGRRTHPGPRLRPVGGQGPALQPPTRRSIQSVTVEPGTQPAHGLLVRADMPASNWINPGTERFQRLLRTPGDPLPDRVHRSATGQHRGQGQPDNRRQLMPNPSRVTRIRNLRQRGDQAFLPVTAQQDRSCRGVRLVLDSIDQQ
jgi:hypothetical protein